MTAEKKKRIPKPQMTDNIMAVIAAIPFFNIGYDKKGYFHGIESEELIEKALYSFMFFYPMLNDETANRERLGTPQAKDHLFDTQKKLHDILDAYLENCMEIIDLEWINENLEGVKFVYKLTELTSFYLPYDKDGLPQGYRSNLILALIRSFKEGLNNYIGRCKKCNRLYEKKQRNSEYCSKYCMNEVFRT